MHRKGEKHPAVAVAHTCTPGVLDHVELRGGKPRYLCGHRRGSSQHPGVIVPWEETEAATLGMEQNWPNSVCSLMACKEPADPGAHCSQKEVTGEMNFQVHQ